MGASQDKGQGKSSTFQTSGGRKIEAASSEATPSSSEQGNKLAYSELVSPAVRDFSKSERHIASEVSPSAGLLVTISNTVASILAPLRNFATNKKIIRESDPDYVRGVYDRAIDDKKKVLSRYNELILSMVAQESQRSQEIKMLRATISNVNAYKEAAVAHTRRLVEEGSKSGIEIRSTSEYLLVRAKYQKLFSQHQELSKKLSERESCVEELASRIQHHIHAVEALRDLCMKLAEQRDEAILNLVAAREHASSTDDRSSKIETELAKVRALVQGEKRRAQISRELAELRPDAADKEYLSYVETGSECEYDRLLKTAAR